MAGLIQDWVNKGGLRISANRGPKSAPSKKIVIDGSNGETFTTTNYIANLLKKKVGEELDDRIVFLGRSIMDILRSPPPNGTPVDLGFARANWQITRVRSARGVGRLGKIIYREQYQKLKEQERLTSRKKARLDFISELQYKDFARSYKSFKKNRRTLITRLPLPSDSDVGLTDFEKFSSQNGDYGFVITNNLPYINRLNNGHSKQSPANFVEKAIALAIQEAKYLG